MPDVLLDGTAAGAGAAGPSSLTVFFLVGTIVGLSAVPDTDINVGKFLNGVASGVGGATADMTTFRAVDLIGTAVGVGALSFPNLKMITNMPGTVVAAGAISGPLIQDPLTLEGTVAAVADLNTSVLGFIVAIDGSADGVGAVGPSDLDIDFLVGVAPGLGAVGPSDLSVAKELVGTVLALGAQDSVIMSRDPLKVVGSLAAVGAMVGRLVSASDILLAGGAAGQSAVGPSDLKFTFRELVGSADGVGAVIGELTERTDGDSGMENRTMLTAITA